MEKRPLWAIVSAASLIALTAVVLGVLVFGAGGANATRLCEKNEEAECNNIIPANTPIKAVLETMTFESGTGPVECEKSVIKGRTVGVGGGPGFAVTAEISEWTFGTCKLKSRECTLQYTEAPYAGAFSGGGGSNGVMDFSGRIEKEKVFNPELDTFCNGGLLNCFYATPDATFTVEHGGGFKEVAPKFVASNLAFGAVKGLGCPCSCGGQPHMDGIWEVVEPIPLYVSKK
jgi:hypothetical protein